MRQNFISFQIQIIFAFWTLNTLDTLDKAPKVLSMYKKIRVGNVLLHLTITLCTKVQMNSRVTVDCELRVGELSNDLQMKSVVYT